MPLMLFFFVYIRVNGKNPAEYSVKEELDRVKQYFSKLQQISEKLKGTDEKQTLKVNVDAANRFIMHSLVPNKSL